MSRLPLSDEMHPDTFRHVVISYEQRCRILLEHLIRQNEPVTARQLATDLNWSIHEVTAKLKVLKRNRQGIIYNAADKTWVALAQDSGISA